MNQLARITILSLIMITLLGCSGPSGTDINELEKQFSTAVPLADINKSLQVVVESKETSFESGSDISLLIYNKSSHPIYFDNGLYVKLLISSDNLSWLNVENGITYFGTTVASPRGTPLLDFVHTVIRPLLNPSNLSVENENMLLRIVITGEIMKNDARTGENVAAYTDVTLKP